MARKVYVDVTLKHHTDGSKTPLTIKWEDGYIYEIEKVTNTLRLQTRTLVGHAFGILCDTGQGDLSFLRYHE